MLQMEICGDTKDLFEKYTRDNFEFLLQKHLLFVLPPTANACGSLKTGGGGCAGHSFWDSYSA